MTRQTVAIIFLRTHNAAASAGGLVAVALLGYWLRDQAVENPLGRQFFSIQAPIFAAIVAAALAGISLVDQLDSRVTLAARSLWSLRAGWALFASAAFALCVWPTQPSTFGPHHVFLVTGFLMGISLLACSWIGVAATQTVQFLALFPYLVRPVGEASPWWAILAGTHGSQATLTVTVIYAAGATSYAIRGPRESAREARL